MTAPIRFCRRSASCRPKARFARATPANTNQINEFIRLLAATGELDALGDESIHVVDLGCGSAYLTFALYHYLTATRGLTVSLTGVDLKADLMARHAVKLRDLGWPAMQFVESRIIDYVPETPPDIVVALHACDTATDEAIAQVFATKAA